MELNQLRKEQEESLIITPYSPTGWQWFWIRTGQLSLASIVVWLFLSTVLGKRKLKNLFNI